MPFQEPDCPGELPAKKKEDEAPVLFEKDKGRARTVANHMGNLKPVFKKDGTVTAGNASTMNAGAAAVVVTSAARAKQLGAQPMVRVVAQATSGTAPEWVMMAPVDGIRKIWAKTGWKPEDVDLYEINEAFAVQSVAVIKELGIDPGRVNVKAARCGAGTSDWRQRHARAGDVDL